MGYLLYCIFRSDENQPPPKLKGVRGEPLFLLSHNGLAAAVSTISQSEPILDIKQLIIYEKTIDSLHRKLNVIPMRYGCILNNEFQVTQHLKNKGDQYKNILKKIENCVEMGIRLLLPVGLSPTGSIPGANNFIENTFQTINSNSQTKNHKGAEYLAARKIFYKEEDRFNEEIDEAVEQCRAAYADVFIDYKTEISKSHILNSAPAATTASIYFLLPRKFVEHFRGKFRTLKLKESVKPLMTGPWPPYNFVLPDDPWN